MPRVDHDRRSLFLHTTRQQNVWDVVSPPRRLSGEARRGNRLLLPSFE
jgi:hypothetical protein